VRAVCDYWCVGYWVAAFHTHLAHAQIKHCLVMHKKACRCGLHTRLVVTAVMLHLWGWVC
jgi:hypothetical protein